MLNIAWFYIFFIVVVSILFLISNIYAKKIDNILALVIGLLLYIGPLFLSFVDIKSVWSSLKFLLSKRSRNQLIENKKEKFFNEFNNQN